jgi:hypothetical protein
MSEEQEEELLGEGVSATGVEPAYEGLTRGEGETMGEIPDGDSTSIDEEPDTEDESSDTFVSGASESAGINWTELTNNDHLAAHANEVEKESPDFNPSDEIIPTYDSPLQTYISARSKPVTSELDQLTFRVRPELLRVLNSASTKAEHYFPNDSYYKSDFYSALLIVGMLEFEKAMGILALYGYGLTDD